MRTQDEILARIAAVKPQDTFGFRQEVLISTLDFDHAKPWLKADAGPADWTPRTDIAEDAATYMSFAWGKVEDHRGLSAGRSVDKMTEFLWLMGRDDASTAMLAAPYAQYGAPRLAAACTVMGWPIPTGPEITNMIAGQPCRPDCEEGCGR